MKVIYLLHFDKPIEHAQHYIGMTTDLDRRLFEHYSGHGAKITAEFVKRRIGFTVAGIWLDPGQNDERKLKDRKNAPKFCPICNKFRRKNPFPHLTFYSTTILKSQNFPTRFIFAQEAMTNES